ncbi:serine/threonine protein kinase [Amycolatopsis umgeniensis]|uniref:Uncharacterized protein n=1 Tax=Amycolatopsis umgeniensis TaxID=336628 RepID=A0A841B7J2_9PSEU|nr:hypothetical protein [Amycolatopsis umgeniensis]
MDDDDVSVADLLIREGWDDHEESRAKSRWRVIAVVIAVVVACGAAGVLVGFDPDPEQNAQPNNISVIEMPKRPSENRGADATSAVPTTETVGTGASGDGETSSQPSKTTSSRRTSSSATSTSDSPDDPPPTQTSSRGPADPPRTTGSTGAPQPPNPNPPTAPSTTPTEECNLWPKWLWC